MASIEQFRKIAVHCNEYNMDESDLGALKNTSEDKIGRAHV